MSAASYIVVSNPNRLFDMPKETRSASPAPGIARIALAPGVRVGGSGFALKRLIGRGGFSEVWLAWDRKREQDVALKFLPHTLLQDASLIERLGTEVRRCQQLDHPAIAKIFDLSLDYESLALSMEYVDGWSLAALKVDRPEKRYSTEEIIGYLRQLCPALDYAHHDLCLVHRDLKPANLLLNPRAHIKLTDYGLIQTVRNALAQQGHLIYGALSYQSPQQLNNAEPSVLDDVYALGATIFDLLTGTPPFYQGEIRAQVLDQPPPSIRERWAELGINDTLPGTWEDTVAACLAKAPSVRPQTAGEVLQGLESPSGVKRVVLPASPKPAEIEPAPEPAGSKQSQVEATPETARAATTEPGPLTEPAAEPVAEPTTEHGDGPDQSDSQADAGQTDAGPGRPRSISDADPVREEAQTVHEPEPVSPEVTVSEAPVETASLPEPASPRAFPGSKQKSLQIAALAAFICFGLLAAVGIAHLKKNGPGHLAGPPGTIDASFQPGAGADNEVRTLILQPDGRIVIGGKFAGFDHVALKGVARLSANGRPDTNFAASINGAVHALAMQPDGKILLGGDFMKIDATPRRRLARLNADGSLDGTFDPKSAVNREVRALVLQGDGKILAGGSFDSAGGNKQNRVTRLNPDGGRDNTFNPGAGANAAVYTLALQRDGKVLAGGDFTRFDNVPCGRIARLQPDGTLDQTFKTGAGATAGVLALWVQEDGKILLSGNFSTIDSRKRNRIARLNSDGSLDETFDPGEGPNSSIRSMAVQPDGKIIVGGSFDQFGEVPRRGVARLNKDASLDLGFDPGEGALGLWRVGLQPDGRVLIAGTFTNVNNVLCGRVARLYGGAAKVK